MDPELTPQEVEDLLAAYAINAVDDDEREVVERHLAQDPAAAAEVQAFRHAAAMLAYTGGPVPEGVWDALAPALEAKRRRVATGAGVATDAGVADVLALSSRRSPPEPMPGSPPRRHTQGVRWLVAAAVAAILAVGAAVGVVVSQSGGGVSQQQALAAAARAARNAPGAQQLTLEGPDGSPVARAVVLEDGTGYLTSDLPALHAGRTYQLWALRGTDRISLGVLGRDPTVVSFKFTKSASGLAVTNEVAGGVKVSHNNPAAVGRMQRA